MFRNKFKVLVCFLAYCCFAAIAYCDPMPPPIPDTQASPETNQEEVTSSMESTQSYEGAFFKMLLTLVALIVFVFLTFWMFRRLSQGRLLSGNNTRSIKIIDKRPLSPKSMLYIVEVGNKRVLIAESHLEVRSISNVELPSSNE